MVRSQKKALLSLHHNHVPCSGGVTHCITHPKFPMLHPSGDARFHHKHLACRVAFISYKEKRRWLLIWSSIYVVSSAVLTLITYSKGPDSHEWYGCSVPLSLWSLFLFLSTLSYYTTDYMHRGQQEGDRERYVYDPKVGTVLLLHLNFAVLAASRTQRNGGIPFQPSCSQAWSISLS